MENDAVVYTEQFESLVAGVNTVVVINCLTFGLLIAICTFYMIKR